MARSIVRRRAGLETNSPPQKGLWNALRVAPPFSSLPSLLLEQMNGARLFANVSIRTLLGLNVIQSIRVALNLKFDDCRVLYYRKRI